MAHRIDIGGVSLSPSQHWSGIESGIPFEIKRWDDASGRPQWCFYLDLEFCYHMPRAVEVGLKAFRSGADVVKAAEFPGGCTFFDLTDKKARLGCDFGHISNLGADIDLEDVALACVKSALLVARHYEESRARARAAA